MSCSICLNGHVHIHCGWVEGGSEVSQGTILADQGLSGFFFGRAESYNLDLIGGAISMAKKET